MNVYYNKEKKQPVCPWDVEELRKNGAKLNANYHEYTSITPFIKTHGEDLCRFGNPGGKYAAAMHKDGTTPSFGERSLFPPFSVGEPDMRVRLTGKLPEGHVVKYGEVAQHLASQEELYSSKFGARRNRYTSRAATERVEEAGDH